MITWVGLLGRFPEGLGQVALLFWAEVFSCKMNLVPKVKVEFSVCREPVVSCVRLVTRPSQRCSMLTLLMHLGSESPASAGSILIKTRGTGSESP